MPSKIKRIENLLSGKSLKKPAINLWKHFPPYDENAQSLTKKTIQFQERFDWDFVKVTYQGLYSVQDFGAQIKWPNRDSEWPDTASSVGYVEKFPISSAEDWKTLKHLDVTKGTLAESVAAVKQIASYFKNKVPVIPTVFNPLTTAIKMSGEQMFAHLRHSPADFEKGIAIIADITIELVKAMIDAGADGIFFASQLCNTTQLSIEEYKKFGRVYDLAILEETKGKTWFNIMHMHGENPMFDILSQYPVQALNWHDRLVDLDLKEATKKTDKLLIGGVEEFKTLLSGTEAEIKAEMHDALNQVGEHPFMFGPGCCVPLNVSEDRLALAKKIADKLY